MRRAAFSPQLTVLSRACIAFVTNHCQCLNRSSVHVNPVEHVADVIGARFNRCDILKGSNMKVHRILVIAALVIAGSPTIAAADCSPACVSPDVCRYNNGSFYCASPHSRFKGGPGAGATATPRGTATAVGGPTSTASTARTSGPRQSQSYSFGATQTGNLKSDAAPKQGVKRAASNPGDTATHERRVQSPRDVASGQATGKRQHKPVQ